MKPQSSTLGKHSAWINKSLKQSSLQLRGDRHLVSSRVEDWQSQTGLMKSRRRTDVVAWSLETRLTVRRFLKETKQRLTPTTHLNNRFKWKQPLIRASVGHYICTSRGSWIHLVLQACSKHLHWNEPVWKTHHKLRIWENLNDEMISNSSHVVWFHRAKEQTGLHVVCPSVFAVAGRNVCIWWAIVWSETHTHLRMPPPGFAIENTDWLMNCLPT